MLYIGFFQLLNLFVRWDKLPTFLAVTNLGALRELLRAKNLHNTSDIAVTEPKGLRPTVPFDPRYLCEREEDGQYNDLNDRDLIVGPNAMTNALRDATLLDIVYTFGVHNPGAVTLRNFPNWMRRMRRRTGTRLEELIDLAAIDILRDRERGVPRYNRFRELFHKPRVRSFEQMTSDGELLIFVTTLSCISRNGGLLLRNNSYQKPPGNVAENPGLDPGRVIRPGGASRRGRNRA
jgi:hypothetical protein